MVGQYSNTDLVNIARMTLPQFADFCRGLGINAALNRRRELQIALANYARTHKMDLVQENIVAKIQKLEKWARLEFMRQRFGLDIVKLPKEIQKQNKEIIKRAKNEWEKIVQRRSF